MNCYSKILYLVLGGWCLPIQAQPDPGAPGDSVVSFAISHTVAAHEQVITKTSPQPDQHASHTSTQFVTFPTDLEIGIAIKDLIFYVYPLNSGAPLRCGYALDDQWELGASVGYALTKDEALRTQETVSEGGLYVVHARPVGGYTLEISGDIARAIHHTEVEAEDGSVGKESNATLVSGLAMDLVVPIDAHFTYSGGIYYAAGRNRVSGLAEPDYVQILGVNLATFRYAF